MPNHDKIELNIRLCLIIQHRLLDLIDIYGDDADIWRGISIGEFMVRMDRVYVNGLKREKETSKQIEHYKILKDFKNELVRVKRNAIKRGFRPVS